MRIFKKLNTIVAPAVCFSMLFILHASFRSSEAAAQTPTPAAPNSTAKAASTPASAPAPGPANSAAAVPQKTEIKTETVTRVVGEAGPRIVTSREVRMNEAIGQVLQGAPSLKRVLSSTDPNFPNQVLRVLDEWTVFLEAGEIGSKATDKAEIQRLAKAVIDGWRSNPDWEKIEPSVNEIREIVERKLVAQNLERLKSDASIVNVTDAEALQYYKKNRLRFGNMPFENFKDNIKSALVRSQTERRLFEWRSVLRRKYRVRNFVGA